MAADETAAVDGLGPLFVVDVDSTVGPPVCGTSLYLKVDVEFISEGTFFVCVVMIPVWLCVVVLPIVPPGGELTGKDLEMAGFILAGSN